MLSVEQDKMINNSDTGSVSQIAKRRISVRSMAAIVPLSINQFEEIDSSTCLLLDSDILRNISS